MKTHTHTPQLAKGNFSVLRVIPKIEQVIQWEVVPGRIDRALFFKYLLRKKSSLLSSPPPHRSSHLHPHPCSYPPSCQPTGAVGCNWGAAQLEVRALRTSSLVLLISPSPDTSSKQTRASGSLKAWIFYPPRTHWHHLPQIKDDLAWVGSKQPAYMACQAIRSPENRDHGACLAWLSRHLSYKFQKLSS